MSLTPYVWTGSLTTGTTVANISETGIPFKPALIILMSSRPALNTPQVRQEFSLGAADGTNQWSSGYISRNGGAATDAAHFFVTTKCLSFINSGADTFYFEISFVSFNSDGFTLSVDTAPASSETIHYIAFGGTPDAIYKVGSFDMNGTTGAQSITGVGFRGKALITCGSIINTITGIAVDARFSFGSAVGSAAADNVAQAIFDDDPANPTVAKRRTETDQCAIYIDATTITGKADFTSFDADGFTINVSTALNAKMGYIVFGGVAFNATIKQWTENTTTGNKSETGVGFRPDAIINYQTSMTSFGSTFGFIRHCISFVKMDRTEGQVAAIATQSQDVTTPAATSSTRNDDAFSITLSGTTIVSKNQMVSFDADGFTHNRLTDDGTDRLGLALCFLVHDKSRDPALRRKMPTDNGRQFPTAGNRRWPI